MSDQVVLTYGRGRGKAEIIRLALCAAGVQYEAVEFTRRQQFVTFLEQNPDVIYGQAPVLRIYGKNLIQVPAIIRYIGRKFGLYGSNDNEVYEIDMLYEGSRDFYAPFIMFAFDADVEAKSRKTLEEKSFDRYLPVYEKALLGKTYLVGEKLSIADLGVLECILATEDYYPEQIEKYPNIQAYKKRLCSLPNIAHYMTEVRKPMTHLIPNFVEEVFDMMGWGKPGKLPTVM